MANVGPSAADVHVNRTLTNISIAYMQDADDFVAHRTFPPVPVANQTDAYWEYDRSAFHRGELVPRARG